MNLYIVVTDQPYWKPSIIAAETPSAAIGISCKALVDRPHLFLAPGETITYTVYRLAKSTKRKAGHVYKLEPDGVQQITRKISA